MTAATTAAVGWATYKVIQKANNWLDNHRAETALQQNEQFEDCFYKQKEGKQRDGTPGWNGPQNSQFKGAKKDIEKRIGRKLSQDEENELHRHISGQDYGFHEIVEEGFWLFNGN